MGNLLPFIAAHWPLVVLAFILLALIIFYEIYPDGAGIKSISPQDLVLLMNRQSILLLDSRSLESFEQGHILGALRYDAKDPEPKLQKKLEKAKDKPVVIYCHMGTEAAKLAQQLQRADYSSVAVLKGGLTAWRQADLPVTKEKIVATETEQSSLP